MEGLTSSVELPTWYSHLWHDDDLIPSRQQPVERIGEIKDQHEGRRALKTTAKDYRKIKHLQPSGLPH